MLTIKPKYICNRCKKEVTKNDVGDCKDKKPKTFICKECYEYYKYIN